MPVVRKVIAVCDKCGAVRELRPDEPEPFSPAALPDERRDGWFSPDREHVLCPSCAAVYKGREAQMKRELKELAGIKTIEVDI